MWLKSRMESSFLRNMSIVQSNKLLVLYALRSLRNLIVLCIDARSFRAFDHSIIEVDSLDVDGIPWQIQF